MNTHDLYRIKLWSDLQKLFKSKGDSILLIVKMLLFTLMCNAFTVNTYAQTPRKNSEVNGRSELTGQVVSSIDGNHYREYLFILNRSTKRYPRKMMAHFG